MNRIRTVKPELFRHLPLFEAEEKYQLPLRIAFVGLFTCCDRQGRFVWQPRRLKVDILPYDPVNMDDVLNALMESGFIKAYEVDGTVYGCIPTWSSHQCPNNKEHPSKLPDVRQGRILKGPMTQSMLTVHARLSHEAFTRRVQEPDASVTGEDRVPLASTEPLESPEDDAFPDEPLSDDLFDSTSALPSESTRASPVGVRDPDACVTREAHKERKGREKKGKERNTVRVIKNPNHCPVATDDVLKIFTHWQQTMQHSHAQLDSRRDQYIRDALRMGYSVDDCCQAITGCSLTPHNQGRNDRGQRYDGLHVIFGSADQIDRFMQNALSPPRPPGKAEQRLHSNTQAAQTWLQSSPPREA